MSFIFIAGSDDFLVKTRAREEWATLSESIGDPHSLEIIDGHAGTVDEAGKAVARFAGALQTVSMFAPEKAIWFRDISFLGDNPTGRAKGTLEHVERLMEVLDGFSDPAVRVLLSAAPVDRRKKAYKWFQKNGKSTYIEAGKDDRALTELVVAEAARGGKRFDARAAAILLDLTGGNARLALAETAKLVTYLGEEADEITGELVTSLVPSLGDSDFFEAAAAFYSLDLRKTLDAIHRHFFAGHDARPLITSLQNRNRLLIQLKSLQASGALRGRLSARTLESLAAEYGAFFGDSKRKSSFNFFTQSPYYLNLLAEVLPRLSLRNLIEFQQAFRQAFLDIVSRPSEQESVMSATAIHCLAPLQPGGN
jgi:DNA polymerase-3 subunit delta